MSRYARSDVELAAATFAEAPDVEDDDAVAREAWFYQSQVSDSLAERITRNGSGARPQKQEAQSSPK